MRLLNLLLPWRWGKPRRSTNRRGTRATSAGRPRVRKAPDWRLRRRVALSAGAALGLGGLVGLWSNGWIERQATIAQISFLNATANAGLKVEDVLVEGRNRTERSEIMDVLGLFRGAPILGFDPHEAKAALEGLPWVQEAAVERRLPGIVYIHLSERNPLARWQINEQLYVIDEAGEVIRDASAAAFPTLPVLVGEDVPELAHELVAMLDSEPELRQRVTAAVLMRGRRWNVRLAGGIDVRLPESDPHAAWAQLARMQRDHKLLERDVITIDLRMPDRLVVRTAPGAAPSVQGTHKGEET